MAAPRGLFDPAAFPRGNDLADIRRVYGDPRPFHRSFHRGTPPESDPIDDPAWRRLILDPSPVIWPSPVRLSRAPGSTAPGRQSTRCYAHRLITPNLRAIVAVLGAWDLWRHVTDFAGCYSYRRRRAGRAMSLHSWAVAVDINAERYPLGAEPDPSDPFVTEVVPVFERAGWVWGGRWTRPDCMHFQCTRGA